MNDFAVIGETYGCRYDGLSCVARVGPASSEVVTPSGYAEARASEAPLLGAWVGERPL